MISDLGYGLNSLAHLALLLLLLTVRKPGVAKHLLVLATAATLLWSTSLITSFFGPISLRWLLSVDVIKQLAWLLFLAACIQTNFSNIAAVLKRPITLIIVAPALIALFTPYLLAINPAWSFLVLIVLSLEVLVLLEVVYRQAGREQWAFKPLIIYLGATNLFEFVTYANATMVNQVEIGYIAARGYIYFLLMPLLVISIRRIHHWGIDIFISRDVVLHSSLLLVAGGYLFVMAVVGYAINYMGGNWGATVQIILVMMSFALLATVFLSNAFRTKIKVFITKHFFANQFDYRVEWVKLTQWLTRTGDTSSDVFHAGLTGMLNAIQYDSGKLFKVTSNGYECVAEASPISESAEKGSDSATCTILETLAQYSDKNGWIIDTDAYLVKPFDYEGLKLDRNALKEWGYQLFVPFLKDGGLWGFAVLASGDKEKISLNWEVKDYLTAVSEQVGTYMQHHEAAQVVAENAQFAAFNRMSAFVLHDLKNVLAQVDLILANAQQHKHNPEFIDDTFETLEHTKSRMEKMLKQLTDKKAVEEGVNAELLLSDIAKDVVSKRCSGLSPLPKVHVLNESPVVVDREKVANVFYHLISNAQQATDDDGEVEVVITANSDNNTQLIMIEDTGVGMDKTFIETRLFKPFDTTKGNAGMGIGAYDAKTYIESIGGKLTVQSEPGRGSCFTLYFPIG
ncbi:XrtA/PEP-CTERM system histidine kinase PrsK [Alteromonas portus]|uniref:XrtA/PEP-CTERM system histidine kinase PrsK n=1 Tax=Alteromonas portus TaxID=2565549 RepID=UPI003BF79E9A